MPQLAYLIKATPKTFLGLKQQYKPYVIGFKHLPIAAKVMHHVNGEEKMQLMSTNKQTFQEPETQTTLYIDSKATLFIPKLQSFGQNTSNQDLTIYSLPFEEFLLYPKNKQVGVIVPYVLLQEDEHEFIYQAHVIDPLQPEQPPPKQ
jgi:hypothetical protein